MRKRRGRTFIFTRRDCTNRFAERGLGLSGMTNPPVISHGRFSNFQEGLTEAGSRAQASGDLRKYLTALSEFDLGRYLIQHRGLNGFWTHYVCTYSQWKGSRPTHALEREILERFPVFLATQERFRIFHKLISQAVASQRHFA